MRDAGRHLIYTLALDLPGELGQFHLTKLLVSSLLRTRFSGDVVVFRTAPHPLFLVPRAGVREVQLKLPRKAPRGPDFIPYAQSQKHEVGAHIDVAGYDKIMFIDADSLAVRNVDHLFDGDWDLAVMREGETRIQQMMFGGYLTPEEREQLTCGGINSGTFAVRSTRFHDLLEQWRTIERTPVPGYLPEQSAFNRVVLDWNGSRIDWPRTEVLLPLVISASYRQCVDATLLHAAGGGTPEDRAQFLYGIFASTFLFDSRMTLFNAMEM